MTKSSATIYANRRPEACPRDPEILLNTQDRSTKTDQTGFCGQAARQRNIELKRIMFNIARLPSVDQTWILRRLSSTELKTLNTFRGLKLLQDAQRFRSLKPDDAYFPQEESLKPLPAICQQLAMKTPLYAAIVIEQGSYPWANLFLERFDADGAIQASIENQVLDVKPVVKQAVFNEWESSVSFERLLDDTHG